MKKASKDSEILIDGVPEQISAFGMLSFLERVFQGTAKYLEPFATSDSILSGVRVVQEILKQDAYNQINYRYSHETRGKRAKEGSILHQFAKVNGNRPLFIESCYSSSSSDNPQKEEVMVESTPSQPSFFSIGLDSPSVISTTDS